MGLSSRRAKVLHAVVNSYISNAEPISSAEIQSNYLPDVSSATIRNELAILEDMGYLKQPHTSAGRVPTAEGYRFYVEKLMPQRKITKQELKIINRYFSNKVQDIENIVKNTAKVISEITNLTGVAYMSNIDDAVIVRIKIVKLTDRSALFVIVTDKNVISDTIVAVAEDIDEAYFEQASNFITQVFNGYKISDALKPKGIIQDVRNEYQEIFDTVVKIIKKYASDENLGELILEGSSKLLQQPEYSNISKAKAMLELLDSKEQLYPILHDSEDMFLNIKIGKDNTGKEETPEFAVVTVSCNINGRKIGNAGVIGPMRMDYPKVISVLDYIGKTLNSLPSPSKSSGEAEQEDDEQTTN